MVSLVGTSQEDPQEILASLPAVDSFPGEDVVILLAETSQRLDPSPPDGGRADWTIREHCRYWLLTAEGAGLASMLLAPVYATGDVRFIYVRAILPTGEVIPPASIEPLRMPDAVLVGVSLHRISFPEGKVGVGAVLEYEAEVRADAAAGFIAGAIPLRWSSSAVTQRHTIEIPPGQELQWNVIGDANIRLKRNGSVSEFTVLDARERSVEWAAPCSIVLEPSIAFTTATSWSAVADAEREMLADRTANDPAIASTADGIVRGVETREAKIEQLFSFVRDDIESDLVPGWEPLWTFPSRDTLAQSMGDCKGKAALLVSLLRYVGVEAYPALVSTSCRSCGLLNEGLPPAPWRIDHVVVAVREVDEPGWEILDPTCPTCGTDGTYFGTTLWILDGDAGSSGTLYAVPWQRVGERTIACSLSATLSASGRLDVRGTVTVPDSLMAGYRLGLEYGGTDGETFERRWARLLGLEGTVVDPAIGIQNGTQGEPTAITFEYADAQRSGACLFRLRGYPSPDAWRLPVPLPVASWSPRQAPFEVEPMAWTCTATLEFTEGRTLRLPHGIHVSVPGVSYDATYVLDGTHVEVVRHLLITTDTIAPEDYIAFVDVLAAAANDNEQQLLWWR
jgi:hypothetical protein